MLQPGLYIGRSVLRQAGRLHRQASSLHQLAQPISKDCIHQAQPLRQVSRHHQSAANRFSMQPHPIAHTGFDRMRKCMPQVQNGAHAAFLLVLRHHPGLDLATALYRHAQNVMLTHTQGWHVLLQPIQERHIGNRPVFDHFGQTGTEFALGQGRQRVHIAHHQARLIKSANHVFAKRMIHGCFATHGRVHLCQQGSGHLHKRHPSHIAGSRKPRDITHNATSQRKNHRLAVTLLPQQGIKNLVQRSPRFVCLAIRQLQTMHFVKLPRKRLLQAGSIQRRHRCIAHNQCLCGLWHAAPGGHSIQNVCPYQNRVAALAQINAQFRLHFVRHKRCQRVLSREGS